MEPVSTADLVALHLGNHSLGEDTAPRALSVAGIGEAVGADAGTMANRIELLSALEGLRDRGLVAERSRSVAGVEEERNVYELTDRGREYVRDLRSDLVGREVIVRENGTERTVALGEMDRYFDAEPLVTACSRLTEDGVLHLAGGVDQRFVDREVELATLERLIDAAGAGEPGTAVVGGEGGIGKTTLVERAAEYARDRGSDVLSGGCRREADRPYAPIREALAGPLSDLDRDSPFETVEGTVDDADQFDARRSILFHEVTDVFETVAGDDGLLLVLDDIQWIGESTLALVEHLTASADAGVVVVGTYRPAELAPDGPLATALAGDFGDRAERIDLEPFGRDDTRGLIQWLLDTRDVPDSFVAAVQEHTGGNPLFVEETVTGLLEDGTVDPEYGSYPESVAEIDVPDQVHAAVEARLGRLDDDGIDVLERGAVLGDSFDPDVLVAATPVDEPTAWEYVDLLVDARIWRVADGRLRFESGVVRTAVLDRLDDGRRRDLHADVAAAIERVHDDLRDWHATVATHHDAAGDLESALDHAVEAGDRAREVYAHEDAIDRYQRALTFARDLDREDRVLDLLEEIGDIATLLGRYDEADRNLRYVQERTDDDGTLRRVHWKRSQIARNRGDYEAAIDLAETGLAIGDDDPSEGRCQLLSKRGWAQMQQGDLEAAMETFEREYELAAGLGDEVRIGGTLHDRGTAAVKGGDLDDGIGLLEAAVEVREGTDVPRSLAGSLNNLGLARWKAGDIDGALTAIERARGIHAEIGDPSGESAALTNLGVLHEARGEFHEALACFEESLEEARRLDQPKSVAILLGNIGSTNAQLGNLEDALPYLTEAIEICEEIDNPRGVSIPLKTRAWVHFYRGDIAAAREDTERALETAREVGDSEMVANTLGFLGRLDHVAGDLERALDRHREALETAREAGANERIVTNHARLTEDYLAAAAVDEALAHAREAVEAASGMNCPTIIAEAEIALGEARCAVGDHDGARVVLSTALERCREVDASVVECEALRSLAEVARSVGDDRRAEEYDRQLADVADEHGIERFRDRELACRREA